MRANGVADWDSEPLRGYRNLPPAIFQEEHIYEGDDFYRPSPLLPEDIVSFDYLPTQDQDSEQVVETILHKILGDKNLPIYEKHQEILEAYQNNQVLLFKGPTGSGKSTELPLIILADNPNATMTQTQPRRPAARNVALRLKYNLAQSIDAETAESLVSYQTAGEREGPEDAQIQVVTDGLQMARQLHGKNFKGTLILDEAHENNVNMDVLLAVTVQELVDNPDLKLVITSATLDEKVADYIEKATGKRPAIVESAGRLFDIEHRHEPDSTIVEETIKAAEELSESCVDGSDGPNGILVFAAGKREIEDSIDAIRRRLPPELSNNVRILPLHAKLTPAEQQAALRKYNSGITITIATNVAQTSLTMPGVKYVVDSGMERRNEMDSHGGQGLVLRPISQADSKQRAGRAGRVSNGIYILTKPDAKTDFVPLEARDEYPTPEILRTDLVRTVLRVAGYGLNIAELPLPNPVNPEEIERAQAILQKHGALNKDNEITDLGIRMNEFPVSVPLARMMVEVQRYSVNTRAYMAAIAAAKEAGGLQYFAHNVGKRWKELTQETSSDLLAQLDIFIAIQSMDDKELREQDLDIHNVIRAREQYRKIAKKVGALQEELLPPTQQERDDIKDCIRIGSIHSVFAHQGGGWYQQVGGNPGNPDTPRQISNRSQLISNRPEIIFGDKYRIEYFAGGILLKKHVVENGLASTRADIGRIALFLSDEQKEWRTEDFTMRNGKYVEVRSQLVLGVEVGVTEEVVAEPSPALSEKAIHDMKTKPGPHQTVLKTMRDIKKQLEKLDHLARGHVEQFTQLQIDDLLARAAEGVTSLGQLNENLRALVLAEEISIDKFVSASDRARIEADAPGVIVHEGVELKIAYQGGKALLRHYSEEQIASFRTDISLPDGRPVRIVYKKRPLELLDVQARINPLIHA